jgi:hypothetical protein
MSKEIEKAKLGAQTLRDFCESWGSDIHARILLEVLFEGLMNEEDLFIFGKQEQAGDKTCDNITGRSSDGLQNNRPEHVEPPTNLGEQNKTNYP